MPGGVPHTPHLRPCIDHVISRYSFTLNNMCNRPFRQLRHDKHGFQLRTTLNGMDFKFVSHGLWSEKQNILLQHMHKKEFSFEFIFKPSIAGFLYTLYIAMSRSLI